MLSPQKNADLSDFAMVNVLNDLMTIDKHDNQRGEGTDGEPAVDKKNRQRPPEGLRCRAYVLYVCVWSACVKELPLLAEG